MCLETFGTSLSGGVWKHFGMLAREHIEYSKACSKGGSSQNMITKMLIDMHMINLSSDYNWEQELQLYLTQEFMHYALHENMSISFSCPKNLCDTEIKGSRINILVEVSRQPKVKPVAGVLPIILKVRVRSSIQKIPRIIFKIFLMVRKNAPAKFTHKRALLLKMSALKWSPVLWIKTSEWYHEK